MDHEHPGDCAPYRLMLPQFGPSEAIPTRTAQAHDRRPVSFLASMPFSEELSCQAILRSKQLMAQ